jgi:hypothetical protein
MNFPVLNPLPSVKFLLSINFISMKKFFLSAAIAFAIFSLSAQIEKGSVLIGGSAGFQFKANKQQDEFVFSVAPYAMYSVIKQLAIGGQLFYAYDLVKLKIPVVRSSANSSFGIGPAIRGNIFIGGKTYLFIHGSSMFGINTRDRDPTNPDRSYYSSPLISWRFGPGLSVFATKNLAVEFGFYYDGMKEVWSIKQKKDVLLQGDPLFTHGLTVAIGLQFYVHKKQKEKATNP